MTRGMRWMTGLFFGVFLTVGIAATYGMLVKPWMSVTAARSWTPVACRIVSSELRTHSGKSTTYSVAIAYVYEVDGRQYTGTRYDFSSGTSSGRDANRKIVARYRKGREAVCYVNPTNPEEAVIERSRVRGWWVGLVPLVFVLAGGGGVYFAIFGLKKAGTENAGVARSRSRSGAFLRSTPGPEGFYAEEVVGDGPVELKPVQSRVAKLVAILVMTVFWNGIVSVFVVNVINDVLRGDAFRWFLGLFMLPFIGVGLVLIGVSLRMAMALANPVPRLTVSRRAFAPGDAMALAWRFDGSATRLKDLRLFLEGREEATYRRGTDTRTDREVFATLELAKAAGMSAGQPGQATLKLPERMMHSFSSDNNRVIWTLKVKGGIDWWPDLDEEFAVTVVPGAARDAAAAAREEVVS